MMLFTCWFFKPPTTPHFSIPNGSALLRLCHSSLNLHIINCNKSITCCFLPETILYRLSKFVYNYTKFMCNYTKFDSIFDFLKE